MLKSLFFFSTRWKIYFLTSSRVEPFWKSDPRGRCWALAILAPAVKQLLGMQFNLSPLHIINSRSVSLHLPSFQGSPSKMGFASSTCCSIQECCPLIAARNCRISLVLSVFPAPDSPLYKLKGMHVSKCPVSPLPGPWTLHSNERPGNLKACVSSTGGFYIWISNPLNFTCIHRFLNSKTKGDHDDLLANTDHGTSSKWFMFESGDCVWPITGIGINCRLRIQLWFWIRSTAQSSLGPGS